MATPAQPSDPQRRSVDLPRGRAAFTDEGEGRVLVAIHGLPGSVRDWRWLAPALPPGIRFIRLDMPGFGESPRELEPGTHVDARADHVVRVMDALGIRRFTVMGHSMGGPVAASVAARHGERVAGLALVASVGLRPHRALRAMPARSVVGRLVDVPLLGGLVVRGLRVALSRVGFPSTTPLHEVAHTFRLAGRVPFDDITANTARVVASTLVAHADDDALIEPSITRELEARLPAGPRLRFTDGGHNLQKSRAVELAAALAAWMETLPA